MVGKASLFRKDIWVFSSNIGNKWMVFSGKGAKIINITLGKQYKIYIH